MEIIFTQTWLAWIVGILLALIAIKILLIIAILFKVFGVIKKIDYLTDEVSDWTSFALDEAADMVGNFKRFLSFAGVSTLIVKAFKNFNKKSK